MLFNASDLFTLRDVGRAPGKPEWANTRAYRQISWKGIPAELTGPGIYALALNNKVFYVGLFAGGSMDPFGNSVLDRWYKHITYQSLRAPEIRFARNQLQRILNEIEGPVGDDIARCLPNGRDTDCSSLDPNQYPLIADTNGPSSTFRKARFASQNWETIRQSDQPTGLLLESIDCIYQRIPQNDAQLALLADSSGKDRGDWVKYQWLRPREADLIRLLRPICNFEIEPGTERSDVICGTARVARVSFTDFSPLDGAVICPAFLRGCLTAGHDEIREAKRRITVAYLTVH